MLKAQGRIGSLQDPEIDLRLDSSTDVTLLANWAYESLKAKPKKHGGFKLKLQQLTAKTEAAMGYVLLPVYLKTKWGELLKFVTEAFLVPGMDVPILLGEDFQINHELTVKCSQEEGTSIIVGSLGHVVEGQSLKRLDQGRGCRA